MDKQSFVNHLRDLGFLLDKKLERGVRESIEKSPDGRALASRLLQSGLLTAFQANRILTGKGKSLILGQYRIVDRLRKGENGRTFKAVHATMGRLVVLRLLASHLTADPESRKRFTCEMQNIAQLSHTNILAVFDAFEVGGVHVLVMEFVEGMDLPALVHHVGPLPVAMACSFIRQTALGLQHAFECGLGYCCLKPENILISGYQVRNKKSDSTSSSSAVQRGVVKLLNLGLVHLKESEPVFEGDRSVDLDQGMMLSACDYLAPELTNPAGRADIRGDIYCLGCTLYFALAGKPPFPDGGVKERTFAHQFKEPAPLEQLRPDVPPALIAIIQGLMAKKAEERCGTPIELANALAPFCVTGRLSAATY